MPKSISHTFEIASSFLRNLNNSEFYLTRTALSIWQKVTGKPGNPSHETQPHRRAVSDW